MIEYAYTVGEALGLAVWTQDEAGPYQTTPYAGDSWQPAGQPAKQPHEYIKNGTAKMLTLFHPASGQVRVKGVTQTTNAILHPWLRTELDSILLTLPPAVSIDAETNCALWKSWQKDLVAPITQPKELPPLRMLLVWDNLAGHQSAEMVLWLFAHGIMPLYTPLGGSWLNMAESIQRIFVRRALAGQHPKSPEEIITSLEAVAQAWNRNPTPFVWGGKRQLRRQRSRLRRQYALGGSGAFTHQPLYRRTSIIQKWRSACQVTH